MELRVLRYFLTVAREESITRAAEVLHITQPTLSRQMVQLEEETGVTLFHRGSRKITLTNEGSLLRRRAEEILELVDKTAEELLSRDEQIEGNIVIGTGELASVEILVRLCKEFQEKYPLVRFELYTATADHVKDRMERGLVDIGLLLEPISMERFEFIRMDSQENWVVLMRPDGPLAEKMSITAKDLAEQPIILPSRLNIQSELAHWFGEDLEHLNVLFTGNLSTNSAIAVRNGIGYAVVIEGSIPYCDQSQITSRPLSPALTAAAVLAWRRNQPFSPAAEKFIRFAKYFLSMDNR